MRKDRFVGEVLGGENMVTPSDLYHAEFKTAVMGGYDKREVDAFLERVGDVFEALLNEIRELKEDIEEQRERITSSREMESTLRNALASAQKFHEDTLDNARREADAIREQARITLARARQQARDLPTHLQHEIAHLKKERDQLRGDLGAILRTHHALVQNIPKAELVEVLLEEGDLEAAEESLAQGAAADQAEEPLGAKEPWTKEED